MGLKPDSEGSKNSENRWCPTGTREGLAAWLPFFLAKPRLDPENIPATFQSPGRHPRPGRLAVQWSGRRISTPLRDFPPKRPKKHYRQRPSSSCDISESAGKGSLEKMCPRVARFPPRQRGWEMSAFRLNATSVRTLYQNSRPVSMHGAKRSVKNKTPHRRLQRLPRVMIFKG